MDTLVLDTLETYAMLPPGGNVIVAFSGGADSTALFHFFVRHAKALGVHLRAAHFNHGLRGAASRSDAAFVADMCAEYGVELCGGGFDMASGQRPKGQSLETWARTLRYAFFEELAARYDARVATAHTLNDNAETVLFHAARGSGPRGLAGIPPLRLPFVRPLLAVSRDQVEQYCGAHHLSYVTDATNAQPRYARNRIRLEVLPALRQAHPGTLAALGRLARDMDELDQYLADQAGRLIDTGGAAPLPLLRQAAAPVRLKALALLAGPAADRAALARMDALVQKGTGAASLPGGQEARVVEGYLTVRPVAVKIPNEGFCVPFVQGCLSLPGGYEMRIERRNSPGHDTNAKKMMERGLPFEADYDKIIKCDSIRTRRAGDFFRPPGRGITKTIKKWMQEQHIPPEKRAALPLLCAGSQVLWVWGAGFCEGMAPSPGTKEWLVIHAFERED